MGRIENSIEIEAPIEEVFAFYVDPRNLEKTVPEDVEMKVEMTSEGPIGVGSTWRLYGVLAGRKLETESESIEFEENRRAKSRQTKGDMKRYDISQVFESTDAGTKVSTTLDYELPYSVLGKLLDKLKAGKELERYVKARDEKSKEILEKG